MKAVVFSGPSLPPKDVRRLTVADWRPPASRGDLYRAATEGLDIIGLIDGYFDWIRSVMHKEILWALTHKIHVIGGASMGALRAAELEAFGMVGVGRVFEAYRDGLLEDDDEVAVMHLGLASEDFAQVTEAMVDIRATIERAVATGVIKHPMAKSMEKIAKSLHYSDRNYPNILELACANKVSKVEVLSLQKWLGNGGRVSIKRADAVELIEMVNNYIENGQQRQPVKYELEKTRVWQQALKEFHSSEMAVRKIVDDAANE